MEHLPAYNNMIEHITTSGHGVTTQGLWLPTTYIHASSTPSAGPEWMASTNDSTLVVFAAIHTVAPIAILHCCGHLCGRMFMIHISNLSNDFTMLLSTWESNHFSMMQETFGYLQ